MATKALTALAGDLPKLPATKDLQRLALWAGAGLALWWVLGKTGLAGKLFEGLAQGAVGAAGGVVTGTVKGIGGVVGVPDTDADQCTIDLANGNMWDASFSCPMPRYMAVVAGRPDLEAEKLKFIRANS